MIKHKHHIIPKHAGGTNDPSNIVELTIGEHANAHKELFDMYGMPEDQLAWRGLSGMIDKSEIIHELCVIASNKATRLKGVHHQFYGKKRPEHSVFMKKWADTYNKTEEHINNLKKAVSMNNKINPPRSNSWKVSVDGVEFNVLNLKKYCRENGYIYSTLYTRGKSKNCTLIGKINYGD